MISNFNTFVLGHFRFIFEEKMDPKHPRGLFSKNDSLQKFWLKIPIFSRRDGDATCWPKNSKKSFTCVQLTNVHRYQIYVWLMQKSF